MVLVSIWRKLQVFFIRRGVILHCTALIVFLYIIVLAAVVTVDADEVHTKRLRRRENVKYKNQTSNSLWSKHRLKEHNKQQYKSGKDRKEKVHSNKQYKSDKDRKDIKETEAYNKLLLQNEAIPLMVKYGSLLHLDPEAKAETLYGKPAKKTGFLTIGIPTFSQPDRNIIDTVQSVLENTDREDKHALRITISVSDFNQKWNQETAQMLYSKFKQFFDSGLIQIVEPPFRIYPNFTNLERRLADGKEQGILQAKKNIDLAYLMLYSQKKSKYYLQLGDNVISSSNFMKDIRNFVLDLDKKHRPWKVLDFSSLGCIGKLFSNHILDKIAYFLLTFYDIYPCDSLCKSIIKIFGDTEHIHYKTSLFRNPSKVSLFTN